MHESAIQSCKNAGPGRHSLGVSELPSSVAMDQQDDAFGGYWWLVHTKSRQEKALADHLEKMAIGYFLPLVEMKRKYGKRVFHLQVPLFPGYLFLQGGHDERYAVLMTHRAAKVIDVVDQERLKTELRHVQCVVMSDEPVDLFPMIKRGRRCRVVKGSLAGLEGVVVRRRSTCRVYIGVEALGQSAELEIDPALLEIID